MREREKVYCRLDADMLLLEQVLPNERDWIHVNLHHPYVLLRGIVVPGLAVGWLVGTKDGSERARPGRRESYRLGLAVASIADGSAAAKQAGGWPAPPHP